MSDKHPGLAHMPVAERRPATTIARSPAVPVPTAPHRRLGNALAHARVVQRAGVSAQAASMVSSPHDRAEVEAVQVARSVVIAPDATASAPVSHGAPGAVQRAPAGAAAPMPVQAAPVAIAGGAPLPAPVRAFMEPRFNATFGQVRIHTGEAAARQSEALNAQAFTVGQHVFFGRNRFQPDSAPGRELIAHELTHTIQQGGAVQRSAAAPAVVARSAPKAHRLGIGDALDWLADKANFIPGFRLLTIVLGLNPINLAPVDRSAANLLRAVLEMIPITGKLIGDALENHGIFAKVGAWVEAQIRSLGLVGSALRGALDKFLATLSWSDIFDLGGVWERAKRIFTEPINRLIDFGKSLVSQILGFIREAILLPLAKLAEGTAGYDLLKAVLQQDPVTGQPVPRTPETLIGGFMKLIGQQEVWENIQKGNAVARAWAWFQGALNGLMGFVAQLPTMFVNAFRALEIIDLVLVPKAFAKLAGVFGGFLGTFLRWAGNAVWNLLEIIFSVVAPNVLVYLKKTGAALQSILKNPIPFVRNLVRAAKLGFENFGANIGTHLKTGLIDWLTGSLPGIYIPKAFSLVEIVKFVLSVLGLTWANIRQKLVKALGEPVVKAMETGFQIVVKLVTEGPAAAWELIKEQLANLKDMVIGAVTDFVVDIVVQKAIPKIISMFIPGAGFISAIVSIYDTIMVFVDKISKVIQVVKAFVDSIVAIAAGAIEPAAKRVESTLAGLLSLAISFLAGFAGLGKVADKIMGVIAKVRAPIDKAVDWLVGWIVKAKDFVVGKAKAAVAAVVDWWKQRKKFKAGGESHEIYFSGTEKNAELMLASDPIPVKRFINKIRESSKGDAAKMAAIAKIDAALAALDKKPAKKEDQKTLAVTQFNIIGDALPTLIDLSGESDTEIAALEVERPNFSSATREAIKINVAKEDRRHIVSSEDMATHYESSLGGKGAPKKKKRREAAELLVERGQPVQKPLSDKKIEFAARQRHRRFFNDVLNLFAGASAPNRALGQTVDPGGRNKTELRKHIDYVKERWALDPGKMKVTGYDP